MTSPLVSVIIPTRNRKELLHDALTSVVQQSYKNLQIIVHDNNSSDGTREYIDELLKDSRVEYYASTQDLSMTANWNTAFSYIKGEYFVRLDDDNIYYPDFIECALQQIQNHHLACISYASLIIHLDHRLQLLFSPDDKVHILTPNQSVYLEYFALTDSNYTLYSTSLVKNIFHGESIYQTTLPDRYMNYRIAEVMDTLNIQIGVTTAIKAITRFDYRPRINLEHLVFSFKDYGDVRPETVKNAMDCQNNFAMHRICTLWLFRDAIKNINIRQYIDSFLIDKNLYRVGMLMGEIAHMRIAYSLQEIKVMYEYAYVVVKNLFAYRSKYIENKKGSVMMFYFLRDLLFRTGASVLAMSLRKKREDEPVDKIFGNEIVKKTLQEAFTSTTLITPIHGSLAALLEKIRAESTKSIPEATALAS